MGSFRIGNEHTVTQDGGTKGNDGTPEGIIRNTEGTQTEHGGRETGTTLRRTWEQRGLAREVRVAPCFGAAEETRNAGEAGRAGASSHNPLYQTAEYNNP